MPSAKPVGSNKSAAPKSPDPASSDDRIRKLILQMDPQVLEALLYGYLAAKGAGSDGDGALASEGTPSDPLDRYLPDTAAAGSATMAATFNLSAAAEDITGLDFQPTLLTAAAAQPTDITQDIVHSIFQVFNRKGIPITTSTIPSTIMALGNWVELGRAIFVSIVEKHPNFTPFADPTRLPRFYNTPLLAFAKAIRDAIQSKK